MEPGQGRCALIWGQEKRLNGAQNATELEHAAMETVPMHLTMAYGNLSSTMPLLQPDMVVKVHPCLMELTSRNEYCITLLAEKAIHVPFCIYKRLRELARSAKIAPVRSATAHCPSSIEVATRPPADSTVAVPVSALLPFSWLGSLRLMRSCWTAAFQSLGQWEGA
jgi:hypothetical protein